MKHLLQFSTVLLAVIVLAALIAHLLSLPGKINLSKKEYQLVQGIYRGWAWIGMAEIAAILLILVWTITDRNDKHIFPWLLTALLCFTVSLAIFFIYTFPANQATANWTELPQNWQHLRNNWEYSHAVRAALNLLGFSFLIVVLLR